MYFEGEEEYSSDSDSTTSSNSSQSEEELALGKEDENKHINYDSDSDESLEVEKEVKNEIVLEEPVLEEEEEEEEEYENYLQKFNKDIHKNYVENFHPMSFVNNSKEIESLTIVIRDKYNNVIDDLHKTIPFLTKYEKTRILGQRAKQILSGSKPYIEVSKEIIDSYIIAEMELKAKKIPFIIRRPLPNGGCEYWKLKDLENIYF
jgi:DNA-directed RNA polymerase subunit K/omega